MATGPAGGASGASTTSAASMERFIDDGDGAFAVAHGRTACVFAVEGCVATTGSSECSCSRPLNRNEQRLLFKPPTVSIEDVQNRLHPLVGVQANASVYRE